MNELVGVILLSDVERHASVWESNLHNARTRIEELKQEIHRLELDCVAIDGALQAVRQISAAPSMAVISNPPAVEKNEQNNDLGVYPV